MKKSLSLILALVMLIGLLPQFTLPARAVENIVEFDLENLRFDDHVDMSGKAVEIIDAGTPTSYQVGYGVEENTVLDTAVVTMEGDTLVTTGIGTATVKVDGETYEITVTAAPISLLLLIGQSNMQGSEGDANQSIVCPDGMVYSTYGDRYTMTTANATNFAPSALTGVGSSLNVNGTTTNLKDWPVYLLNEAGVGKAGPDSGFAYEWVKQTGEKVWIVNAAHGGSSIKTWQDGGENYEECVLLFKACMETLQKEIDAGHFTLSHMGYFWCQGCSDYSQTAEWYVNKYLAMHNNLKTELAFSEDVTFEFGGIIPVRAGNESYTSYRQGVYTDTTSKKYHESFKDLRFTGPRVAQYWMGNNPELPDIWNVCNIGEDWVWMPDGTNGVSAYFQSHYPDGTVDYMTQVAQKASWYTPTTPAAVHDSIHYNQIGYNEVGREAARNALIMLGEIEDTNEKTTVTFYNWTGYEQVLGIETSTIGKSQTLVVPVVSPCYRGKEVSYQLSDGLKYDYYDLTADSYSTTGMLTAVGMDGAIVTVSMGKLNNYSWELENGVLVSTGETENTATKVQGKFENGVFVDTQYRLADAITLRHDQNWVLEWKMTGPWYDDASTASKKLFCEDGASATPGAMCLMVNGKGNWITIGYYGTSTHISYGLDLDAYGISVADTHVYRLVNHINGDGTNAIYLFVDGQQIGPMTHYFTGSSGDMGKESDYLSGKDLFFGYLGTPKYPLDNGSIAYISVAESGASQDIHFHNWSNWKTVTAASAEGPGMEQRKCDCGETETRKVEGVWQTLKLSEHMAPMPENYCSGTNLWAEMEHDKYYFASGTNWAIYSSGKVYSVTIPVNSGDQIFASSFGAAGSNGHASSSGIRTTFFDAEGVLISMKPAEVYAEFSQNGYLTAPEGAVAINIAMWTNDDSWEIYILNRDHDYKNGTCAGCGETQPGPIITQQPVDAEAKLGERYMVEVKAEGEGLKYQWYFRNAGSSVWYKSSVKDNTYDDVMTKARAGREVYCVITDANGNTVTTDTVKLICLPSEELAIVTQPTDGEAVLGERYCVTVEAKGEGLKYQWYFRNKGAKNWSKSSVTDNTYDDIMTTTRDGREVYCVITDLAGNKVTTDIVKLVRVPMKLEITSQPTNATASFGELFCATVEAKGEGLKYQWYYRNAGSDTWHKSGVRDNTYDDIMTKARMNREVYCVITDMWGNTVTSDIVKLIAVPKVELKLLGQSYESAAMGDRFCVTVEAQGEGLTYQWYFRNAGSDKWYKSSVKDNTYDDVMTKARANREVYCVITDAYGNQIVTEVVTIRVAP